MTFTRAQLDALGVATDLQTAAEALGISRATAYELARESQFPVPVIRFGSRYSVPTAGLREVLLGETAPPADEVLARLDRIATGIEELIKHAKIQSINTIGVAS
ncbi:helix-turn-helix transcriptional regulator [Gordonia sp. DT219]|uniref:helix-turn-helix transcriptional regulator n=1 Tax=Gordonia sp. DT219 TaxID=3416658 RepID=UPI003CF6707C